MNPLAMSSDAVTVPSSGRPTTSSVTPTAISATPPSSEVTVAARLAEIEGQAGAAAAVLQSMRGDWQVTPAVAFNVSQDMVHRVVGKPGVILVAEGAQTRTKALLLQEKKRVNRVAAEVPVYEISVGDEDGQVPLRKLQNHILRLPRNLDGTATSAVKQRMRALGAGQPPIPKGPMPKGGKVPRGKMR